jgi:predicted nucleic acid-binding protein
MKAVFADTFYFLALLNERDAAHDGAVSASRSPGLRLLTTEFVLLELADALCKPGQRDEALSLWSVVQTEPAFRLIPASTELVKRGRELYCPLTGDRHFEQAGFKPLLA